jgi:RNA-directed DNA polymerase
MDLHQVVTKSDLADILGLKVPTLNYLAFVLPDNKKYREYKISKRSGGTRTIHAPIAKLKEIQERLLQAMRPYYQARSCAHGYVEGKSIVSNAGKHVRQRLVARVDIEDFFPSITSGRIVGLFNAAPFNLPYKISILLAKLVTCFDSLPQGAPTSPIISNFICRRLDRKLSALASAYFGEFDQSFRCYPITFSSSFSSLPVLP